MTTDSEAIPTAPPADGTWSRLSARVAATSTLRLVALCGTVAALVRAGYWALVTRDIPLTSDALQYHELATNIANGRGYVDTYPQIVLHHTAFRPPVYPYLLGTAYWVFGDRPVVGRALNLLIGVAVVCLVTWLVTKQFGKVSGLIAGLAAAVMPNLVANDTYLLTESISLLLLVLMLWAIVTNRWVLAGVFTGVLILTRPSAQYLVIVLAIWVFTRIGWRKAAGYGLIAMCVVAPWVGRNWAELGSPVLVTSNGFNFAAIYSPPALDQGGFIDPNGDPWYQDRRLDQFNEITWDRHLRQDGMSEIRHNPLVVLQVVHRNLDDYFEIPPGANEWAEQRDGRSWTAKLWTLPIFYAVLVGGVVGLWLNRRRSLAVGAILIGVYFTAASLVFVAPPRLRSPLDLMLCIGLGALALPRSQRRDPSPVAEEPTAIPEPAT